MAELKRVKMGDEQFFRFCYLPAFKQAHLASLPGLSGSKEEHLSKRLWPYFLERIPDRRRPEIEAIIRERKINPYDELQMLAELGSKSVTDPFEIRRAT